MQKDSKIYLAGYAGLIKSVVGYEGELVFDASRPDGILRKLLDVSKINGLNWHAKTTLEEGIKKTYNWFVEHCDDTDL